MLESPTITNHSIKSESGKVDSLLEVARYLYIKGTKLAFGNLEAVKPFITCPTCVPAKHIDTIKIIST